MGNATESTYLWTRRFADCAFPRSRCDESVLAWSIADDLDGLLCRDLWRSVADGKQENNKTYRLTGTPWRIQPFHTTQIADRLQHLPTTRRELKRHDCHSAVDWA